MSRIKNEYDIAKVITLVLVVFAHSTKMFTSEAAISRFDIINSLSIITSYVYSFHMPVFIALSGSVYAMCMKKGKYKDFVEFVINKAKRLLLPYVFFSLIVVVPVLYVCNLMDGNYFNYILNNFVFCLDNRHLWYVIVLFNIFIIMRIIGNRLDSHKILIIIVFAALAVSPYFPFLNYLKINKTLHLLLFFYMGYLLVDKKRLCFNKIKMKYIWLVFGLLCTVCFWSISNIIQASNYVEKEFVFILKQCAAVSGVYMIYGLAQILFESHMLDSMIVRHVLKNSYGIYLFHPMIIYMLVYYMPINMNCYFVCSILFVFSFILADMSTEIMRLLRLQLFIGEGDNNK